MTFAAALDGASIGINASEIVVDVDPAPGFSDYSIYINASALNDGNSLDGRHVFRTIHMQSHASLQPLVEPAN